MFSIQADERKKQFMEVKKLSTIVEHIREEEAMNNIQRQKRAQSYKREKLDAELKFE